jgi:peptidoglycan hydrolase CwlO-like protein
MEIGLIATALGLVGTLVGYGVWVGKISQRIADVEKKQTKLETRIEEKLDVLTASIYETNIKIEGLTKDIQYLKDKRC